MFVADVTCSFSIFTYFFSDVTVRSDGLVIDDLIEEIGGLDDEPAPKPHLVINVEGAVPKLLKSAIKGVIRGKGQNSHKNINNI